METILIELRRYVGLILPLYGLTAVIQIHGITTA